jgi:hypothetical protein
MKKNRSEINKDSINHNLFIKKKKRRKEQESNKKKKRDAKKKWTKKNANQNSFQEKPGKEKKNEFKFKC